MRFAPAICLLICAYTASVPAPSVTVQDTRIILRNQHVVRVLERQGDTWRTTSVARADGSDALPMVSDEFLIRLMDGAELTAANFAVTAPPSISETAGQAAVELSYAPRPDVPPGAPRRIACRYWLGQGPYLRKSLTLTMDAGQAVDRLEVERFRVELRCDRGGRGEPVFLGDSWFAGLEYPGSQTAQHQGLVTLAHFPGLAKHDAETSHWLIHSKTAVLGTGAPGDPLDLAFGDYLDTIRRPPRNFLQYNSWYDWRGDELTLDNMVRTFEKFRANLLEPYGLQLDAFVPDDGWQDPNSIWVPRPNLYPDGFAPLRDALQVRGTRLGVWMPLNGTNLNADWGAQQGYEKSNQGSFYCLVGPRYNAAIRDATRRIIQQGNLAYYKHDFNTLSCSAEGHGHLPDDRHGHEANLDAQLDLLAFERQLQPDIFLNITSSVWLSPWWLMHADSIWMCAGDFGYDKTFPQLSPREWDISYRDAHFYTVYRTWRHLVPVSAMMTHGIISGKYCRLGGDPETLREWSDMVVMYYGRGVQLKELYITPDMLDAPRWQVLGEATRWAVENAQVLEKVVMVGGDPRRGDIYGYAHWLGDRGLLCLRNPDLREKTVALPFDKSVQYRGPAGQPFRARVIYPYVEDTPTQFTSGQPLTLSVAGCSVMVFEFTPGLAPEVKPATVPALRGADAQATISEHGRASIQVRIPVPDEEMQRCDLYLLVRGIGKALGFETLTLDGQPAQPRRADGPGWELSSIDLRTRRGATVQVLGTLPGGSEQPFSAPDLTVSAWLVADRPVPDAAPTTEHLPFPISRGFRRQTVELLPATKLPRSRRQPSLTAEDLKSITAAKLRIRVFDVNREPQYQGKFIHLNGHKLAPIPPNQGELSAWQEVILDLQPEQLSWLQMTNAVKLDNAGGDCYKFSGLALAVQLADGTWVESNSDETVRSSVDNWAYTEGEVFTDGTSGDIHLSFHGAN